MKTDGHFRLNIYENMIKYDKICENGLFFSEENHIASVVAPQLGESNDHEDLQPSDDWHLVFGELGQV